MKTKLESSNKLRFKLHLQVQLYFSRLQDTLKFNKLHQLKYEAKAQFQCFLPEICMPPKLKLIASL